MNKFFLSSVILIVSLLALLVGLIITVSVAADSMTSWHIDTVDDTDCWFPSLALDNTGLPHISYGALGELKYAWYDGATWHNTFVEEQPGSTGWHSSIALDTKNNPHISYYSPYSHTLMYTQYYSSSWHFELVGTPYDSGGQTSLDLDTADLPHIAYWDPTHRAVMYAYQDTTGWQVDTITTMIGNGQDVSLALTLDTADHPHLCYYDYDADTLNYTFHDGFDWQFETIDDVFYNGQKCAIALDAENLPHIGYRDIGLQYAHKYGNSWQITMVDDDFFAGEGVSLALDSHDQPHISYANWASTEQYDLRYAFSNNGQWWTEVVNTVPSGERFAETSLALDDEDRPHIGYWHVGSDNQLEYAAREAPAVVYHLYLPSIRQ